MGPCVRPKEGLVVRRDVIPHSLDLVLAKLDSKQVKRKTGVFLFSSTPAPGFGHRFAIRQPPRKKDECDPQV
jgi:hypothetical protein